jgi:outer membrane protein assembly factor BamD (BamD/ComL family)
MNAKSVKNVILMIAGYWRSLAVSSLLIVLAGAITAFACAWGYVTDHSVRFNSFRSGRGFYRLPPLPLMYDRKTGKEISAVEIENYLYPEENPELEPTDDDRTEPSESQVFERARLALQQDDVIAARKLLETFLSLTAEAGVDDDPLRQAQRNSAYDILDALTAVRQGSAIANTREYIEARLVYDNGPAGNLEEPMPKGPIDKNLQDNWEYLRGAFLYSKNLKNEALQAFLDHGRNHPRSEKHEAVLYMAARLTMESSYSFGNTKCGIMGKKPWSDEEFDAAEIEPAEKCKDQNWHAAVDAFRRLMLRYPHGRYANDTRGWLAYLYRRGGERAKALAEYYRLLGHPSDRNARLAAKKSLQVMGHEYDDEILDKVEELIGNEADAALAYSYHRIYNYATDFTYEEFSPWCCYGEGSEWQQRQDEKRRVADSRNKGNHELERIARFATAMIKRHPQARTNGAFLLRVAEAQLELQNYPEAQNLAQKALAKGLQGDFRAEALWVKGSSEHRQKDLKIARTTFTQLIEEFPKGKLAEGARRLMAMTAEDQGDLEFALDQYLALDYKYDVAYFVDVLLPTDQLAKFVNDRKGIPPYNQLLYSLGVRYMRDRRWNDARAALRQVQTEPYPRENAVYDGTRRDADKSPNWEWRERRFIRTSWVMRDLKTIDTLEHMEQAVERGQNDEAKAEAMYQLASFYFASDDLLLYNPAAWDGMRRELLSDLSASDRFRLPNESQSVFDHSQSHDTFARAIPIYLEIATRFPNTKAAEDALYSAAVAHERLSDINDYWRGIYENGLFAGPRYVTYADVRSAYPRYQLPRGTDGWEPSTRTVNGGPGWAPKARPAPPLTRTQKFERRLKYVSDRFQTLIRPRIGSFTGWIGSLFDGYISAINVSLSWLLTIVSLLLAGYFALLGVHFRSYLPVVAKRMFGPEIGLEQIPRSESRVEKVIDDPM